MIYTLSDLTPSVAADVYIADNATVVGNVTIGEASSIWFNTVVRADNDAITIGHHTNVQDASVLHVDAGAPLTLGNHVSIGHMAMLHGCHVDDGALIGIGAVVLNNAHIGADSLIGAKSLVTEGKAIPPRSLVMGAPAKVVRELSDDEVAGIRAISESYARRALEYRDRLSAVLAQGKAAG